MDMPDCEESGLEEKPRHPPTPKEYVPLRFTKLSGHAGIVGSGLR
jgi:hypothetical protein